jgi:DNA-binding MarR family transcriptional regulator
VDRPLQGSEVLRASTELLLLAPDHRMIYIVYRYISMPYARDIRPDDYLALAELRFVIRRFLAFSEAAARAADIEPQQHQLLLVLKALRLPERPTIRTTAERLLIQHNSAVELVSRSVERGLVERRTGDHDRREVSLKVTARGERVLRRLTLAHRRELKSAAPLLLSALEALIGGDRAERPSRVRLKPKTRTNTTR